MDVASLPDDPAALKSIIATLARQREQAELKARESELKARELEVQKLRLEVELLRLKRLYYGPRADRLSGAGEMAQMLLDFAAGLEARPVNAGDLPPQAARADADQGDVRRVRRGRRDLAAFDHLPVVRHVHDLPEDRKPCPCCGAMRRRIGEESSWQVEYVPGHFERVEHVRVKYACRRCEQDARHPQIELVKSTFVCKRAVCAQAAAKRSRTFLPMA